MRYLYRHTTVLQYIAVMMVHCIGIGIQIDRLAVLVRFFGHLSYASNANAIYINSGIAGALYASHAAIYIVFASCTSWDSNSVTYIRAVVRVKSPGDTELLTVLIQEDNTGEDSIVGQACALNSNRDRVSVERAQSRTGSLRQLPAHFPVLTES